MSRTEAQTLFLAASPDTLSEQLEELAQSENPEVIFLLAKNPSVPLPVLCRLWARYPQQMFENPILPLLLLEDPTFFLRRENHSLVVNVLKLPSVPAFFLSIVLESSNDWFLSLMAQRQSLPFWVWQVLAEKNSEAILEALALNQSFPDSLVSTLLAKGSLRIRCSLVSRANPGDLLWEEATNDIYPQVRCKIAERADARWVEHFVKDPDSSVREAAAKNQNLSSESAALLAKDPIRQIREAIAENPSTPEDVLLALAVDSCLSVRAAVANRSTLSETLFDLLSKDSQRSILRIIANRIDLPEDLKIELGEVFWADLRQEMQHRLAQQKKLRIDYDARLSQIDSFQFCGFASNLAATEAWREYQEGLHELDQD